MNPKHGQGIQHKHVSHETKAAKHISFSIAKSHKSYSICPGNQMPYFEDDTCKQQERVVRLWWVASSGPSKVQRVSQCPRKHFPEESTSERRGKTGGLDVKRKIVGGKRESGRRLSQNK